MKDRKVNVYALAIDTEEQRNQVFTAIVEKFGEFVSPTTLRSETVTMFLPFCDTHKENRIERYNQKIHCVPMFVYADMEHMKDFNDAIHTLMSTVMVEQDVDVLHRVRAVRTDGSIIYTSTSTELDYKYKEWIAACFGDVVPKYERLVKLSDFLQDNELKFSVDQAQHTDSAFVVGADGNYPTEHHSSFTYKFALVGAEDDNSVVFQSADFFNVGYLMQTYSDSPEVKSKAQQVPIRSGMYSLTIDCKGQDEADNVRALLIKSLNFLTASSESLGICLADDTTIAIHHIQFAWS